MKQQTSSGRERRTALADRRSVAALPSVIALAVGLLAAAPASAAPERYVLDPNHMAVAFSVMHAGYAKTLGQFRSATGSFVFDPEKPSVSDIDVTIQVASVDTGHTARDEHLRKEDFLWADRHPQITFRGTSAQQTGPRTGTVTGDLTVRGVTRPVNIDVTWNKSGAYPFGDQQWVTGISARTTIRRSEFGMTYAVQGGLVGDEVEIVLEFEAIRQPG